MRARRFCWWKTSGNGVVPLNSEAEFRAVFRIDVRGKARFWTKGVSFSLKGVRRPDAGKGKLTPHIRPISARSTVAAQRLTQDHARSFCTMKTGTARVSLRLGRPQLGSPPDAGFEASPGKTESNEKKNECVFIGS